MTWALLGLGAGMIGVWGDRLLRRDKADPEIATLEGKVDQLERDLEIVAVKLGLLDM